MGFPDPAVSTGFVHQLLSALPNLVDAASGRARTCRSSVLSRQWAVWVERLLEVVADQDDQRIPSDARVCLEMLGAQLVVVKEQLLENDRRIRASARETEVGRRLMEIPGVGPLLASAFVASVADPTMLNSHGARGTLQSHNLPERLNLHAAVNLKWS